MDERLRELSLISINRMTKKELGEWVHLTFGNSTFNPSMKNILSIYTKVELVKMAENTYFDYEYEQIRKEDKRERMLRKILNKK